MEMGVGYAKVNDMQRKETESKHEIPDVFTAEFFNYYRGQ